MKQLITLSFSLVVGVCAAQPVMQASDLNPNPGEVYNVANADWMPEGNWGNNVTWDFSTMQQNGSITITNAVSSGTFPAANVEQTTTAGPQSSVAYLDAATNGQFIHGIDAGGTVITYQIPMKTMALPLNDAVYETNNFSATFTSQGIDFTRAGTSQIFADAWGTVITPEGTFTDVMRVRLTLDYVDTYIGGTITYQSVTYAWYKAGAHYPVVSVSQFSTDTGAPTQYSAQYLTNVNLGLEEEVTANLSVYPNPVSDDLTVEMDNNVENGILEVHDMLGNIVYSEKINSVDLKHTVNLSHLAPGVYKVWCRDESNNSVSTQNIVKK